MVEGSVLVNTLNELEIIIGASIGFKKAFYKNGTQTHIHP
jgi:hypothetical protein